MVVSSDFGVIKRCIAVWCRVRPDDRREVARISRRATGGDGTGCQEGTEHGIEHRAGDLLAALDRVLSVHQHFRLDDRHEVLLLAERGVSPEGVSPEKPASGFAPVSTLMMPGRMPWLVKTWTSGAPLELVWRMVSSA
jgi:hypothetical protein